MIYSNYSTVLHVYFIISMHPLIQHQAMIREEVERILAMRKVDDDGSERAPEEGVAQGEHSTVAVCSNAANIIILMVYTFPVRRSS